MVESQGIYSYNPLRTRHNRQQGTCRRAERRDGAADDPRDDTPEAGVVGGQLLAALLLAVRMVLACGTPVLQEG